jgi:TorA maturation chaperone TorD
VSLALLSNLWLHEPDVETVARAVEDLGLPAAAPADLAIAYADLFLLNVYLYGTSFTDPFGELNAPAARQLAARYEAHGYRPAELNEVGGPDHLGLCIGFLAGLDTTGPDYAVLLSEILVWAPVCCLAAERDPSAHPFYRDLGRRTRAMLWSQQATNNTQQTVSDSLLATPTSQRLIPDPPAGAEVGLRDILRFWLSPAQCGVFLSRSRLGQMAGEVLGQRLPFGSRVEVAEALFTAAGESGMVAGLLAALEAEIEAWADAYRSWGTAWPAWRPTGETWLARIADAHRRLAEMRRIAADS